MKNILKWVAIGLLLLAAFAMTMMVPAEQITQNLMKVAGQLKNYALFVHALFLGVVVCGIFLKSYRNRIFGLFMIFVSLSAAIVGIKHMILPNIIIFLLFAILISHALYTHKLHFDLEQAPLVSRILGVVGLCFGFWYLHWVEAPVLLNALLYSPVGIINCPTMLTVCAFLCLSGGSRPVTLDAVVGIVTLYFGFFGVFKLGATVDVVLIACALFVLVRLAGSLRSASTDTSAKCCA
jgi:HAMP domain-containing protein